MHWPVDVEASGHGTDELRRALHTLRPDKHAERTSKLGPRFGVERLSERYSGEDRKYGINSQTI